MTQPSPAAAHRLADHALRVSPGSCADPAGGQSTALPITALARHSRFGNGRSSRSRQWATARAVRSGPGSVSWAWYSTTGGRRTGHRHDPEQYNFSRGGGGVDIDGGDAGEDLDIRQRGARTCRTDRSGSGMTIRCAISSRRNRARTWRSPPPRSSTIRASPEARDSRIGSCPPIRSARAWRPNCPPMACQASTTAPGTIASHRQCSSGPIGIRTCGIAARTCPRMTKNRFGAPNPAIRGPAACCPSRYRSRGRCPGSPDQTAHATSTYPTLHANMRRPVRRPRREPKNAIRRMKRRKISCRRRRLENAPGYHQIVLLFLARMGLHRGSEICKVSKARIRNPPISRQRFSAIYKMK
jgi:hypothetical protein